MRVNNVAIGTGAEMVANTVVYLRDGTPINFIYEVDGLPSFKTERKKTIELRFLGHPMPVLPIDRIRKSKAFIGRSKDLLHIQLIDEFLACAASSKTAKKKRKTKRIK